MKTKLLFIASLLMVTAIAGCLTGCLTPVNPNDSTYVENKAYVVSKLVTVKMVTDKPERRPKFEQALADLKTLDGKTNTTLAEVIEIVNRIPSVIDGKNAFYVQAGVLIFKDELNQIGIKNPALMPPVVHGLVRGVGEGLAETKPPSQ